MITCPQCKNTLPDWSQQCQFCGTSVATVARPKTAQTKKAKTGFEPAKWIFPVYYILASVMTLDGLYSVLLNVSEMMKPVEKGVPAVFAAPDFITYIALGFNVLYVLVGIGLLARIEFVRAIVNFFCYLKILLAIINVPATIGILMLWPLLGLAMVLVIVLQIGSAAMMIYLIGETDTRPIGFN